MNIILKYCWLFICIWLYPDSLDAKNQKDIFLCTWNIGHFSNGAKPYSLIDVEKYRVSLTNYWSLIYDEIQPDIITINEYNNVFCGKDTVSNRYQTSSLLFNAFKKKVVGPQCWGICNAIFSNLKMKKSRIIYFESQKRTLGDDVVKSRENYYIESNIYIYGKKVKLVCLHLLFSDKVGGLYQYNQIQELLERYRNVDKVVICGDWNTETYSSLKNEGYNLVNDCSLKTFPSKGYALDNIAVKGFEISEVRMVKTNLSDHYPLVCRLSLKE